MLVTKDSEKEWFCAETNGKITYCTYHSIRCVVDNNPLKFSTQQRPLQCLQV